MTKLASPRLIPDEKRHILIQELEWQQQASKAQKDILIVVHDQLNATRDCINSIQRNTTNYRLMIWDNASDIPTANYLRGCRPDLLFRSQTNEGFIVPNNNMMKLGKSPYLVLLNNDTIVSSGWSEALVGCLEANPEIGVVGYEGVLLNEHGIGCTTASGYELDFIAGWCMCFRRSLYEELGGFDSLNLQFAYGEDSDFSLRAREKGHRLYALNLRYIRHLGQTTIRTTHNAETEKYFASNHAYLRSRWHDYLTNHRVTNGTKKD